MAEDKNNADSTSPLSFEEFVKQTLAVVVKQQAIMLERQDLLQHQQNELRQEMVGRFLQLSRQIRDFDIKVDIYTREHSYMKDDIREMRAKMSLV